MATLALVAGTSIALVQRIPARTSSVSEQKAGDQEQPAARGASEATAPKPADAPFQSVRLNLVISGLGREGCDAEVKPGNASCKFRAFNDKGVEGRQHISSAGTAAIELREIEVRGADRTCTVAITVLEPGRERKTVYRGFRLAARVPAKGASIAPLVTTFTCFLSSPSKLAKLDTQRRRN
jgi:hypothetical protein